MSIENKEPLIYNIYLEPGTDYVTMQWNGYANSGQFREGTELMLNELIHHKVTKVLGDVKEMVLINSDDQQWLVDYFIPRAIAYGFRTIAMVRPVHYFNKVAIESVAYKVNQDQLTIQFFNDVDSAKAWLNSI
jgi:hypothetical protein